MPIGRLEGSPFNERAVRWDDSVDGEVLVSRLNLLSQAPLEELRAPALFVRSHLPYPAARAEQAAQQLIELVLHGENQAWLASLAGNVPQAGITETAADICATQIKAGSKKQWGRALLDMPRSVAGDHIRSLLMESDRKAVSAILSAMEVEHVVPGPDLWQRLIELAKENTDDSVPTSAIALLVAARCPDSVSLTAQVEQRFGWLLEDADSLGTEDYVPLAALASMKGYRDSPRYEELLRRVPETEPRSRNRVIPQFISALTAVHSDLLGELLPKIFDEFNLELLNQAVFEIGRCVRRQEDWDWLASVFILLREGASPGITWLGSALSVLSCIEMVWRNVAAAPGRRDSMTSMVALVYGGDPDALVATLVLSDVLRRSIASTSGSVSDDPLRGWDALLLGIAATAAWWPRANPRSSHLRWKVLSELLEVRHTKPEDLSGFRAQHILLGMCDLCLQRCFPASDSIAVGDRVSVWIHDHTPFPAGPAILEQGEPVGWAIEQSAIPGGYMSPEDLLARFTGESRSSGRWSSAFAQETPSATSSDAIARASSSRAPAKSSGCLLGIAPIFCASAGIGTAFAEFVRYILS